MRPVGILGGMGPEATILLMQKVLDAVDANDDADHVPLIVHQNPQVPSRIKALIEGVGEDPAPVLRQMAQGLEAAGAQALAMPCNTAHHYAGSVQEASDLAFLDMLVATTKALQSAGAKQVGVLASPATRLTGVINKYLEPAGLAPLVLVDDTPLLQIIQAVKAGQNQDGLKHELNVLGTQLIEQGADHLLVACTELSLMMDALPSDVPATDSLDCLVGEITRFAQCAY